MSSGEEDSGDEDGLRDRRRFLAAAGTASASGLAGCFGILGGGGSGGDGGGGPLDGNGGSDEGDGSPGPPSDSDTVPDEYTEYVPPASEASTTYDVEYSDDAEVLSGEEIDAVTSADRETGTYTIDESALGRQLEEGSVLLISGVDLRRITSTTRSGGEVTVETEPAAVTDAIENGRMGWDADLSLGTAQVATDPTGSAGGGTQSVSASPGNVQFSGVSMVHDDGRVEEVPEEQFQISEGKLEWNYTQNNKAYTFKIDVSKEQATVSVQVAYPADSEADLAFTAEGQVGTATAVGTAEMRDGNLQKLDVNQDNLGGKLTLEIAAAGAGTTSVDYTFPGLMFQYTVFVGAVPITIGIETRLIGTAKVPAEASATGKSTFTYDGQAGLKYGGSSVDVDATMGTMEFDPEPADAAGNIGSPVDLEFGVAFPRIQLSVFDTLLMPYIHTAVLIGSTLTWGPLCKQAYVRFVVQAGYDLEVFGVSLASDQETLYEDKNVSKGDSCPSE